MTNRGKEHWIPCVCGAEGMHIEQDTCDGDVYFAMWHYGHQDMSIMHRLWWIWSIIKGRPFHDQLIIDGGSIQSMIDVLEEMK